jgi:antitoxin (DNA-binding transcriptional repressor) of toxin-antitoxin stability system
MTPTFEFPARLQVQAESQAHARQRTEALVDALVHGEATLLIEPGEPIAVATPSERATPPDRGTASPCIGSAIARRPGGP